MTIRLALAQRERRRDDPPFGAVSSPECRSPGRGAPPAERNSLRCPVQTLCPWHLIETTLTPTHRNRLLMPRPYAPVLTPALRRARLKLVKPKLPGGVIIPSFDIRPCMGDPLLSASTLRGDKCKVRPFECPLRILPTR